MKIQENTKDWWEQRYQEASPFRYSKEPSAFLMKYSELLPKEAEIMDLACGEGRNAIALALKGFRVKAADFSETALDRAKQCAVESDAKVEWKKQDLDFFMPALMSFDAILAIDFRPPPTVMKNLLRGLKRGGLILMENYLIDVCRERKDLEVFETFKPGELLKELGGGMNYQVRFYSEYGENFESNKVYYIAQKTEML